MDLERLFRCLLVIDIALAILVIPTSFVGDGFLPPALQEYMEAESETPLTPWDLAILAWALPLLGAVVLSWVGLFRWWSWAPHLYLAVCVLGTLLLLITGPTVETAFQTAIDTAHSVLEGVILGIAFFSDLRERFRSGPFQTAPTR